MKANELMIGDWVQVYGHNNNTSIPPHWYVRRITTDWLADIESRTKTDEFLISRGLTPEHPCIGDTNPIPLTEEILMANKFRESIEEGTYYFPERYEEVNIRGYAVDTDGTGRWMITDHELIVFRYVHELQRALRVCGLWDLANNFKL